MMRDIGRHQINVLFTVLSAKLIQNRQEMRPCVSFGEISFKHFTVYWSHSWNYRQPYLWSSSGVLADNSDITVDFPAPWRPMTPTTNISVWSLRYCNTTQHLNDLDIHGKHILEHIRHTYLLNFWLTSMALSHQFIWSSTNLILCFIFSGGRSLDWPTIAESHFIIIIIIIAFPFLSMYFFLYIKNHWGLTIYNIAWCRSTHSSVLDLVDRLCGTLSFLL